MDAYGELLRASGAVRFGSRNVVLEHDSAVRAGSLRLKQIKEFHRVYDWA
jgi:hypothetical protein